MHTFRRKILVAICGGTCRESALLCLGVMIFIVEGFTSIGFVAWWGLVFVSSALCDCEGKIAVLKMEVLP